MECRPAPVIRKVSFTVVASSFVNVIGLIPKNWTVEKCSSAQVKGAELHFPTVQFLGIRPAGRTSLFVSFPVRRGGCWATFTESLSPSAPP